MRRSGSLLSVFFAGVMMAGWSSLQAGLPGELPIPQTTGPKVPASFQKAFNTEYKSAIGFEKNKGQWPEQVEFKADLGNGRRVFLERNKFKYVVMSLEDMSREHEAEHEKTKKEEGYVRAHVFEMVFLDANVMTELEGGNINTFHYNYYLGNDPSHWASDVPVYKTLRYKNLYEGIDLEAYENNNQFKYDYIVKAGADVKNIRLRFNGVDKLELKGSNLYISTSVGDIVESVPYAYQRINGAEIKVACEYKLDDDGQTVSFSFPEGFDPAYELIIDPLLVASTHSGSTITTYGHCATYDTAGNIFTGGRSFGNGYPVTTGAIQLAFGGFVDIAISKLNPTGSSLLYATYLGGTSSDYPHSLFVDTNDDLYVYGSTTSTNYPTTSGCFDNTQNGMSDMIISKLNTTGTVLLGSTYVGGSSDDGINTLAAYNYGDTYRGEIVVSAAGDVFIVGTSMSTNFPATSGAYDVTQNGSQDAVVYKMSTNLTSMTWATFLGGSGNEAGCSIRLNSSGDIYVCGLTEGNGFPTVTGALTTVYQGGTYDGFVSRLNSSGTTLMNSTYIGTGALDITYFVEVDLNNDIYIYGISAGTLPITMGCYSNPNSLNYLQKLNPSLSTLVYSTTFGNGTKNAFSPSALMVDLCQNVYMSGWGSNSGYSVTTSATQATTSGSCFYLTVLSQNAASMIYGSFFGNGGEHVDGGTSRFDPNGVVYQAVCKCGTGFPTLPSAFSPSNMTNGCDIVVFKIDFQVNCNPLLTNTIICYGNTATINIVNVNSLSNATYSIQPGGQVSSSPSFTVSPSVTTAYTVFVAGTNGFNALVTNTGIATVSVAPKPQSIPSLTQAACGTTVNAFDLGLSFTPSVTPSPTYAIFWSPIPYGVLTPTQTSSTGGIPPGVYNATVVADHGCKTATSFTIDPIPTAVSFSLTGPYVINCATPVVTVNASPATYSYTWYGTTANYTGSSPTFSLGQSGSWTVVATDLSSGCGGTQTFAISQNTTASTATVTPLMQNITCSVTSIITVTAVGNPSVNINHYWITPIGGTLTMNSNPAYFVPGLPGTYTHVLVNTVNGCSVSTTFTVTSSSGFPTFSVSSPQNYTLGCGTKSVATINILSAQTTPTPGGPVSYTIIGPPTNTNYIPGPSSSYTVNVPGTWTVITKDNTNFCESKVQVSVLQNAFAPDMSVVVPLTRLTCYDSSVVLNGLSTTPNTSFDWSFPGTPGHLVSNSITVNANTAQVTNTLVANYTLTVTDNNNTCSTFTVVPIEQNLFPPIAAFSGQNNISCMTPTIAFTNQSSTTIPPYFHPSAPVIAYVWDGPTPQVEMQLVSTYVGAVPGTYTMIARDLNNGCFSVATKTVGDFRVYPDIQKSEDDFILDCAAQGVMIYPTINGSTTGFSYQWLPVATASFSSLTDKNILVNRSGQYNVVVTNTINGCTSIGMVEVVSGSLQASFISNVKYGFAPLAINFTNTSASSSTATPTASINSYWNFGNGTGLLNTQQSILSPVVYTQPGTYTVTLYAQKGECLDSTSMSIQVEIPSSLVIPNVFTPNGDGNNDLFFVKATNLDLIDILVIDRWGHKVYELSSSTGNIEWDGKNQYGKDASEGVYLYTLKATGKDGMTYNKQGTITLLR